MRGEHATSTARSQSFLGSSPLARGAPAGRDGRNQPFRIIPACAGSTRRAIDVGADHLDHPRLRGEHLPRAFVTSDHEGSSPLARGAHAQLVVDARVDGIIPACAGSTRSRRPARHRCRDHPRLRGEHVHAGTGSPVTIGSSPLARGALVPAELAAQAGGIIPACAGSTARRCEPRFRRRDHPRLRGEHKSPTLSSEYAPGSSPLARGARTINGDVVDVGGIIPACAGSTRGSGAALWGARDHPRLRGEHRSAQYFAASSGGSSPLARGALHARCATGIAPGIIPACAGSTSRRLRLCSSR